MRLSILKKDGTPLENALEVRGTSSPNIKPGDTLMIFYSHFRRKEKKKCIHFLVNGTKPYRKALLVFGEVEQKENVTVEHVRLEA